MVRTLPCHGRGREFESRRPRQLFLPVFKEMKFTSSDLNGSLFPATSLLPHCSDSGSSASALIVPASELFLNGGAITRNWMFASGRQIDERQPGFFVQSATELDREFSYHHLQGGPDLAAEEVTTHGSAI